MIFAFESLSKLEKDISKAMEPYIDFEYSLSERCYYWTKHHYIENGNDIYKLRLYSLDQLKQGLICSIFEEAKCLSMIISGDDEGVTLKNEYPWLTTYLIEHSKNSFIKNIALPVSEYIRYYYNDFKKLQLLDFEEIYSFRNH